MEPSQSSEQPESIFRAFNELGATLARGPLKDFSGLRSGSATFCQVAPRTAAALSRIIRSAYERDIAVRTRAQGHSLNGSTLPDCSELLISTGNIRHVRFDEPGTITAGSGVVLWVLQHMLRTQGFDIPVLNDGYPGPSVGGYLAAGGFGPGSDVHGGFWDNVVEVTFIDGRGELHRTSRDDPLFPWLFGSMGQLGVIVEARLTIIPHPVSGQPKYPVGTVMQAPRLVGPTVPAAFASDLYERLFWFTLFVPDEHLDDALEELANLERGQGGALQYAERYRYRIRHRDKVAPLVYPEARSFTATGAWGWLKDETSDGVARLNQLDREFMAIAMGKAHYRRYIQSELPSGPAVYKQYFEPAIFAAFRDLKSQLDPKSLLNRGTVFFWSGN
jgi:FAD/FMN-containing dehydrogenase